MSKDIVSKVCHGCKGKDVVCCNLDPVFLTKRDINLIKNKLELHEDEFLTKEIYQGDIYYNLKTDNGHCIFSCNQTRRCKIYGFRPIDCILFPLDIHCRNNKFFWIYYNFCGINKSLILDMLTFAEGEILPLLGGKIIQYADEDMKLYEQKKWVELREVNFANK